MHWLPLSVSMLNDASHSLPFFQHLAFIANELATINHVNQVLAGNLPVQKLKAGAIIGTTPCLLLNFDVVIDYRITTNTVETDAIFLNATIAEVALECDVRFCIALAFLHLVDTEVCWCRKSRR